MKNLSKYFKRYIKATKLYTIYTDVFNISYQVFKFIKLIPVIGKNYIVCRDIFKKRDKKFIALLPDQAIGPMIMFSEYYLRYCIVQNINPWKDILLIVSENSVNTQFIAMLSRVIRVIKNSKLHSIIENGGNHYLHGKPFYIKNDVPSSIGNGHIYLPSANKFLDFSQVENERGGHLLKKIGIEEGKKFVCMHNHSSDYWKSKGVKSDHDSYRSSNWENFGSSIELLRNKNIESVRVGFHTDTPNNCKSLMILGEQERKFMDFYLQKNCTFSVCGDSGIAFIPFLFKTPILYHNFIPMGESPTIERGIVIPKLIKNLEADRYISIRELLGLKHVFVECDQARLKINKKSADAFQSSSMYSRYGLAPEENSKEEIEAGVVEMLDYINGDLYLSKSQLRLQHRFKSLFPINHPMRRSPNYFISPTFLEKNDFLLY